MSSLAKLAVPLQELVEVATFIAFAQHMPGIGAPQLQSAAAALCDHKTRQILDGVWKDTSDTPGEPRDAAVKKAFDSLPKAWRDNVAQVEKLVKTGDAKVLRLVSTEPLTMKVCDEKTEAALVAKVREMGEGGLKG